MYIYFAPFALVLVLALSHQFGGPRFNKAFYGPALFALGLFAGLRFEVGADWLAYQSFFENIVDTVDNPFTSYFGNVSNLQFESGYYLLVWLVKRLGGAYWVVFLLASVFCSYCIYRFTRRFPGNKFYILAVYIGYSFLLLQFAQVRQSIAVGCFLLGCDQYLEHGKRFQAVAIACSGLLFQYSAILYVLLLVVVLWWPARRVHQMLALLAVGAVCVVPFVYDPYQLATLIATSQAAQKIAFYQANPQELATGQIVYALVLLLLTGYLVSFRGTVTDPKEQFVIRYAIFSLLFTVLMVFVFPTSYDMYSRAYLVASIFEGYAASLVFSVRRGFIHDVVFVGTCLVAFFYYSHILSSFGPAFVPYRSVL